MLERENIPEIALMVRSSATGQQDDRL